ncbi:MAG: chemotaxis protein CheA [Geobacter sp.]|nr:chemotaxis protein CheA [Geobacter sp.]
MTISNDASGRAVKDFLAEAEEIIDQLSLDLVALSDCADSGDCNPEIINSIFRGAHSLKGLAGMFGFGTISDLAHNLENLLDSLRLGKIPLNHSTVTVLFDSMELLGALVRSSGDGDDEKLDISEVLSRINACMTVPVKTGGGSPLESLGIPSGMLNALTEYEEHRLLENIRKGKRLYCVHASFSLATFDSDLGELTDTLKNTGEVISTLPSAGGNLDAGIDFDLLYGTDLAPSELRGMLDHEGVEINPLGSDQPLPLLQQEMFESPVQPGQQGEEAGLTAKSMSRTVRVDIGKLDELMNIVGELVLSHSTIAGLTMKLRSEGFSPIAVDLAKAAKGLERRLSDLQKGVMEIRMIPVGQLFDKMTRIVRKISREQEKKVDLRLFGADTELDKLIVEDISDPLMHIIRNAVDHGIEPSEERIRLGKNEKGTISLSSYQKGNHVVIEVEDDGRGIDLKKVKQKALKKGLIQSVDGLSDREAMEIIFLPGFSTADQISEVSGRGVGMDVVKNNIAALSGMVDVESEPGKGCRVIITLPITLAIMKALIIACAGRTYAIPITSILETLAVDKRDLLTIERREVMQLREATLPLVRLDAFFDLQRPQQETDEFYVVVVGVAEKKLGLIVDNLTGQQDIVIKSLGDTLKGVRGVSGAADLGDQRTILVLDVGGIVGEATRGML